MPTLFEKKLYFKHSHKKATNLHSQGSPSPAFRCCVGTFPSSLMISTVYTCVACRSGRRILHDIPERRYSVLEIGWSLESLHHMIPGKQLLIIREFSIYSLLTMSSAMMITMLGFSAHSASATRAQATITCRSFLISSMSGDVIGSTNDTQLTRKYSRKVFLRRLDVLTATAATCLLSLVICDN